MDVTTTSKQNLRKSKKDVDEDFVADSSSEEDDEDTIKEQEKLENENDHKEELEDLEAENDMSIEELRKKYASLPVVNEDSNISVESESSQTSVEEKDDSVTSQTSEEDVDMSEDDNETEVGLKLLLEDSNASQNGGDNQKTENNDDLINDAAKIAESLQPKGNTLSSTSVSKTLYSSILKLSAYSYLILLYSVLNFRLKPLYLHN